MSTGIKNIAFLCHPYHRGGVTRWMVDAAEEALKHINQVYFITVEPEKTFIASGNKPTLVSLLKEIKQLKLIAPKAGFIFELGTLKYRSLVYVEAIKKYVPDGTPIVVSDDFAVWEAASLLANRNPMIGVIHSSYDPGYFSLYKRYSENIAFLVCVSNRVKENILKIVEKNTVPIAVIPCGIPVDSFNLSSTQNNSKEYLRLIWIGRLEENSKRISDIPKIALKLKETGRPFQLDIIGHGSEREYLEEQIQLHHLSKEVIMHGWMEVKEIKHKLQESDLMILPSNYEGMSVAVMEAFASGIAVVSTRVSGVEDLELHPLAKDCLWLYPVGDIDKAIQCIEEAQNTPAEVRKKSARQLAEKEFSIETCLIRYKNLLGQMELKAKMSKEIKWPGITKSASYGIAILRKFKHKLKKFSL